MGHREGITPQLWILQTKMSYEWHLDAEQHQAGKENTQKIESKHIHLQTCIKQLVRRTLCFSKTERMHNLVIRLFINRYESTLSRWK